MLLRYPVKFLFSRHTGIIWLKYNSLKSKTTPKVFRNQESAMFTVTYVRCVLSIKREIISKTNHNWHWEFLKVSTHVCRTVNSFLTITPIIRNGSNQVNYTSATEAPFCIKFHQCGSTPKVWKQKVWWAVSVSNMHTPPSTQQLMQSERHPSRRHQARDACLSIHSMEGRRPPPSHLSRHGSRNTTAAGIRKEMSGAARTCR